MKIPSDWDQPGADNAARCKKFSYGEYQDKIGRKMPYRYFAPAFDPTDEAPVPLVLYLHGADAVGRDNEQQLTIHDIGTVFADDAWQGAHPCHILAPQYHRSMHWAAEGMQKYLYGFLEKYIRDACSDDAVRSVDHDRIYVYGYSAGGIGTFRNIKAYPHYYAGAIVICGATTGDDFELLADTPMWLFHAEDDMIVPVGDHLYAISEGNYHGSQSVYEKLSGIMGDKIRYTGFKHGEMKKRYGINPHCTWVPAAEAREAHEWLFEQSRGG